MKKISMFAVVALLIMGLLVGCGGGEKILKDGTYEGKTKPDDRGAYGKIQLVIKGGEIAEADYEEIQGNGEPKDEDYQYQTSVDAQPVYEKELVAKQDPDEVDIVAGATSTWNKLKKATKDAIAKAE